ncbi:MAG TPA: acyltransferase [Thermoleophilaceae bacterium]
MTPAPSDPLPRRERFTAGDPLRALAALSIVVVHAAYQFGFEPGGLPAVFGDVPARFFTAIPVAVNVFFVLSGYLIARPFVRAYLDGAPLPQIGRYLRNRALRIVPAYWVTLTVLLLLYGTLGSSAWGVLETYGFLQSLFLTPARGLFLQTWSVIVEVGFYLFVPLAAIVLSTSAARRLDRRGRLSVLAVGLVVAWVVSALIRNNVPETIGPFDKLQLTLPSFLWSFVPGIALSVIELSGGRALAARANLRRLPVALLALATFGYGVLMAMRGAPGLERSVAVIVFTTVASGAVVAAPLVLQWSGRPCWRWLDNRPLHWVGVRSYSLYLVHLAVLEELREPVFDVASGWPAFGLLLLLGLPLSLLLSHLMYELVERPFLQRRLPWRRPAREATAAA